MPDGTIVTIEGVLTTRLGELESNRGGFVQDATGGIAVYLDAAVVGSWPAGTTVTIRGTVSSRFALRTLKCAEAAVERGSEAGLPAASAIATGDANEAVEGVRVTVTGTVDGAPDVLADGLGITVDDGSGPVRAVVGDEALAGQSITSGQLATISGPLGQRDSSGTGSAGYRVHATLFGELVLAEPTPTPSPTPSPTPTPPPTPTPSPTPAGTPSPTPTPNPSPGPTPPTGDAEPIATVRGRAIGASVTVEGTVTAEVGRLGTPALIAIADGSGGIAVRVPGGAGPFSRGTRLQVRGTLAAPYGQLEIRPTAQGLLPVGSVVVPEPQPLGASELDEGREGLLLSMQGTLAGKPRRSAGGGLTVTLERPGASPVKAIADATSLVAADAFVVGRVYRLTGVVGQRASKKGVLDGYRLCLRDAADIVALAGLQAVPDSGDDESAGDAAPSTQTDVATLAINAVRGRIDESLAIAGIVTTPATLLDSSGRRVVVQDGTGAIEVLLPRDAAAPSLGTRVRVEGTIGVAYGAPRLRAASVARLEGGSPPRALVLGSPPTSAHEWLLVSLTGRIESVRKLGDRWRAELVVGGQRAVIAGQAGSGIPVSAVRVGSRVQVVGIARRANPAGSDQRFAVTPRFASDLRVLASSPAVGGTAPVAGPGSTAAGTGPGAQGGDATDANLIDLAAFLGRTVRVGGLITDIDADGIWLDDGTTLGLVVLRGQAAELLGLLEIDDALNATGVVEDTQAGLVVLVADPGGIALAGRPVAPAFSASESAAPLAAPADVRSPDPVAPSRAGSLGDPWDFGAGVAGLASILALTALSGAVTVLRRVRARRLMADRIVARVAAFDGPSGRDPDPRSAERGSSTIHSA